MLFFLEHELQKLFERLRDNYRRCLRRREKATRSGAGHKKLPTCDFFGELSFLHDVTSARPTASNIFTTPPPESPAEYDSDIS